MSGKDHEFNLAGANLDWPIGSGAGLTNHPDINAVANRLYHLVSIGVSVPMLGSWTLGEPRVGNAFIETATGYEEIEGSELVDLGSGAGYNAKGLPGPGTDNGIRALPDLVDIGKQHGVEIGLSISPHGGNPEEELKEMEAIAKQALKYVLFVEINLSCPNLAGRPAFYLDEPLLRRHFEFMDRRPILLNRYGMPGLSYKWGPVEAEDDICKPPHGYMRTTSNTLGNQIVPSPKNGQAEFTANNGKGGKSGPALRDLGRKQLELHKSSIARSDHPEAQLISALGVNSGEEVYHRVFERKAAAVQLVSILQWPELVGFEHPGEVVDYVKKGLVDSISRSSP